MNKKKRKGLGLFGKVCSVVGVGMLCGVMAFGVDGAEAAKKVSSKVPKPEYPPLKAEYYPISNNKYPKAMTNPNAHTREVVFKGTPLDIYTQINMVSQIVLPNPPMFVAVGKPEAYTVDIVPEFNSIFLKPAREVECTNMIVQTETGGTYIFILKENPYVPWDIRCKIVDPYKQIQSDETENIIAMLCQNRRMPHYQYMAMDLRTPETSAYLFDPMTKMGCVATLKRALCLPGKNITAYWVNFKNPEMKMQTKPFSLSEKSVYTSNLKKIAVLGYSDESYPRLEKNDSLDMFIITEGKALPSVFDFKFAMMGDKNVTVQALLPTAGKVKESKDTTAKTTDNKLMDEYNKMVASGQIKPMTQDEIENDYKVRKEAEEKRNQMKASEATIANQAQTAEMATTEKTAPVSNGAPDKKSEAVTPESQKTISNLEPMQLIGFPEKN